MGIAIVLFFVSVPFLGYFIYNKLRSKISTPVKIVEFALITIFLLSLALFGFLWSLSSADYHKQIDILNGGYTPFAMEHVLTLIVFFVLAIFSALLLWLKGSQLPPILFVLAIVLLLIGVIINFALVFQVSSNTENSSDAKLMLPLPIIYILIACILVFKIVAEESTIATNRTYKNKYLSYLNRQLAKTQLQPMWVLVLLIPVFILIMAILVLFGQDAHAITKVFTETTTWHFSEKTHPPFLDHRGHYLCTVAVCGNPRIVKPLRLGKRHGHEIIVNRQLLIANAFEELIQENTPKLHRVIRNVYDRYGYPLSKKITTPANSNMVYRLMKPLEYFFLIILYLCCVKPEVKINKQYVI